MEDLTVDLVKAIHTRIMAEERGDCHLISEANLHQMVFQANLIPDCVPRAAFVFYSLCAFPAFREGNSATALAATEQVLATGGYRMTGKRDGVVVLAEGILAFTTEPEEIEQWLNNNVEESTSR